MLPNTAKCVIPKNRHPEIAYKTKSNNLGSLREGALLRVTRGAVEEPTDEPTRLNLRIQARSPSVLLKRVFAIHLPPHGGEGGAQPKSLILPRLRDGDSSGRLFLSPPRLRFRNDTLCEVRHIYLIRLPSASTFPRGKAYF